MLFFTNPRHYHVFCKFFNEMFTWPYPFRFLFTRLKTFTVKIQMKVTDINRWWISYLKVLVKVWEIKFCLQVNGAICIELRYVDQFIIQYIQNSFNLSSSNFFTVGTLVKNWNCVITMRTHCILLRYHMLVPPNTKYNISKHYFSTLLEAL